MSKQEMQTLFGLRIQQARKEQHMTREELADRVGISTTFCANLECGNKMMSVETLDKLSDVLGVSTDFLMGQDIRQSPDSEYCSHAEGSAGRDDRLRRKDGATLYQ